MNVIDKTVQDLFWNLLLDLLDSENMSITFKEESHILVIWPSRIAVGLYRMVFPI